MTDTSIIPTSDQNNPFQVFKFNGIEVRAKLNEDGKPIFIAGDICKSLGLDNISRALSNLPDDEKGLTDGNTPGGVQSLLYVTESGLYRLIFRSNKSEAERFRQWVFNEVLPSIRKTGSYSIQPASPLALARHMLETLEQQQHDIDDLKERTTLLEAHVQPELDYYTIMGFCHKRGMTITTNQAISLGQKCKRLSVERNVPVGKVNDARYGEVNTYHLSILNEIIQKP